MEWLSHNGLVLVIQNLRLALDYQHQQLDQSNLNGDEIADAEDYLVQADRVLSAFEDEYERRRQRDARLVPLADFPRLKL